MKKYISQKTECAICFQVFVEPKILPCLHTLCNHCVHKVAKQYRVRCPYCSAECDLKDVKADFNMVQLVEAMICNGKEEAPVFTKHEQLEHHIRDMELLIDEALEEDAQIAKDISHCEKAETRALDASSELQDEICDAIRIRFEEIDEQIVQRCKIRRTSCEKARKLGTVPQKLAKLEDELKHTRQQLRNDKNTSRAKIETSVKPAQKVTAFAEMPKYKRKRRLRFDLQQNKIFDLKGAVRLKVEEGKFAICQNCGNQSADYDMCDSCKKPLPDDAKLYAPDGATSTRKCARPAILVPSEPPAKEDKEKVAGVADSGIDKKAFYGKAAQENVPVGRSRGRGKNVRNSRGRGLGAAYKSRRGKNVHNSRGRRRGAACKSRGIVTMMLSSDDEDYEAQQEANQQQAGATPVSAAQAHVPKRLRMDDETGNVVMKKVAAEAKMKQLQLQQQQLRKQAIQQQLAQQDMDNVLVQLVSRSIRIGSFRAQPSDAVKLTVQGVQFTIQWGADCLQIHIGANEIISAQCHFGDQMPCMLLQTTPGCAERLREALQMHNPVAETPYYDPTSNNEVHKYITVIFESLGEADQGIEQYFWCIFSVMQDLNPFFKNGGQLLKEIDYQDANDLLISSTPHAQLQLMNLGLGSLLDGDEDEPVDRSRSPSPPRIFTGKVIKLFTYPPAPAKGAITVTNEDLFCLNEGEFLNDVIIDFYLKYIFLEKLSEDMKKRTHIFSSFFYRRLTLKENKRHDDPNVTALQKRHARVKTWTRHVDLFKKDFIIVPINESAHWYLAIICYPGALEPVYASTSSRTATPVPSTSSGATQPPVATTSSDATQQPPVATTSSDGTQPPVATTSSDTTQPPASSDTTQPPASSDTIQPPASSDTTQPPASSDTTQPPASSDTTQPPASSDTTQPPAEKEAATQPENKPAEKSDMLDQIENADAQNSQGAKSEASCATDKAQSEEATDTTSKIIEKQPCILVFDSLAGPSRTSVMRTLREYLQAEWDVRRREEEGERTLDKDNVKGCTPRCPQQLNFSDCGVFVLQYVESFFDTPIADYRLPIKGLTEWFSEETALYKREELRLLIMDLKKDLNPGLEYDPAADGCIITMEDELDDMPDLTHVNYMAAANRELNGNAGTPGQMTSHLGTSTASPGQLTSHLGTSTVNAQLTSQAVTQASNPMVATQMQLSITSPVTQTVVQTPLQQITTVNSQAIALASGPVALAQVAVVGGQQIALARQPLVRAASHQLVQGATLQIAVPANTQQIQVSNVSTGGAAQYFIQDKVPPTSNMRVSKVATTAHGVAGGASHAPVHVSPGTPSSHGTRKHHALTKQTSSKKAPVHASNVHQYTAAATNKVTPKSGSSMTTNNTQSVQSVVNSIVNTVLQAQSLSKTS